MNIVSIMTGYAEACQEILFDEHNVTKEQLLNALNDENGLKSYPEIYECVVDNYNCFIEDNPEAQGDLNIRDFCWRLRDFCQA